MNRPCYLCVDLKRYFASAECAARGLDPFKTNLVVADDSRGKGALCLAVTPALSEHGVKNRCRLYEIPDGVEYIIAKPRMRMYMRISAHIYGIYRKFVAEEDIFAYSIDEVFINAAPYLSLYKQTAKEFAVMLMDKVFEETQITATAGIGTNLFLAIDVYNISFDWRSVSQPANVDIVVSVFYSIATRWLHGRSRT